MCLTMVGAEFPASTGDPRPRALDIDPGELYKDPASRSRWVLDACSSKEQTGSFLFDGLVAACPSRGRPPLHATGPHQTDRHSVWISRLTFHRSATGLASERSRSAAGDVPDALVKEVAIPFRKPAWQCRAPVTASLRSPQ